MPETIAYTAEQVADLLNLSVKTVRRHTTDGWFPCHRIGKRAIRYTRADIDSYLARWAYEGYEY